jgi:flagellar protein FliO/FliZ
MPDLGSLLRVVVSLALVLALLWTAARALQRGRAKAVGGVDVDVLARLPLSPKSSVAVVRLGGQALVLGVTEGRVDLLSQTPLADVVLPEIEASSSLTEADGAGASLRSSVPAQPTTSPLAGSALSRQTWSKALDAVRQLTVRP